MQYLVATKQENKYTFSVVIGDFVIIIMNIALIPKFEALGAIISLILADSLGVIIQLIMVRRMLNLKHMLVSVIKYFIASLIMLAVTIPVGNLFKNKV